MNPTARRSWAWVLGLSLDQVAAWGVLYYAYNVLSIPIARDLGLSGRFVAGAFSLTLLVSGGLARPVGRILDRSGSRNILLLGTVIGATSFAALGVARGKVTLLLAFGALGIAQALALYEPAFRTVLDWFPGERARSRALLALTSIGGLASTVFLPLATLLVGRWGWRIAVLLLAALFALLTLPMRLALPLPRIVRPATRSGAHPPSPRSAAGDLLAAGFALQAFAATGVSIYLVWHFVERGASLEMAAAIAGLAGAAQVPGRLLLAPLQRAVQTKHRLPLLLCIQAVSLAGIAGGTPELSTAAAVLFGVTNGTMTLERAGITVEWFGRETFGARSGDIASFAWVARAAAPYAVEVLHGSASYGAVFRALAVVILLGAAVIRFTVCARGSN
jgi:MFS family permease